MGIGIVELGLLALLVAVLIGLAVVLVKRGDDKKDR